MIGKKSFLNININITFVKFMFTTVKRGKMNFMEYFRIKDYIINNKKIFKADVLIFLESHIFRKNFRKS